MGFMLIIYPIKYDYFIRGVQLCASFTLFSIEFKLNTDK